MSFYLRRTPSPTLKRLLLRKVIGLTSHPLQNVSRPQSMRRTLMFPHVELGNAALLRLKHVPLRRFPPENHLHRIFPGSALLSLFPQCLLPSGKSVLVRIARTLVLHVVIPAITMLDTVLSNVIGSLAITVLVPLLGNGISPTGSLSLVSNLIRIFRIQRVAAWLTFLSLKGTGLPTSSLTTPHL